MRQPARHCIKCNAELVRGENWKEYRERSSDYRCNDCVSAYGKVYYKTGHGTGRAPKEKYEYMYQHKRVQDARGKATEHQCARCEQRADHWATLHDRDGNDPWTDFVPLCATCHRRYDKG